MSKCSNCNEEGTRVRSKWNEKGQQLPDECPSCSPGSFQKFTDPSDKKIWMGYEAHPNEYAKRYDSDGIIYERKPEYRAEQEEILRNETEEERTKRVNAEQKKRRERRTAPMTAAEQIAAIAKAREIAGWIESSAEQGIDVN